MSGSAGKRARETPEKTGRQEPNLKLATAERMLPLVERVAGDLAAAHREAAQLRPQLNHLERERRTLGWPERQRRYDLSERAAAAERRLQEATAELGALGLVVLDAAEGRVGFPTVVNGRRAFFAWQPGDEGVRFWHYPGEIERRPIPGWWLKAAGVGTAGLTSL